MNCEEAQRSVLLAETGELPDAARRKLDAHLQACGPCATYRRDIGAVQDVVRNRELPRKEPAPALIAQILTAAQERRRARFRSPFLAALALAASLTLIAGGVFMLAKPTRSPAPPGIAVHRGWDRVHSMRVLVAMVSEDSSLEENGTPSANHEEGLKALARQLLALEGLSMENGEEPELLPETSTSPAEPGPTVLRGRSTSAFPPGRCV